MQREIWLLINDFMDFNYTAPLVIYGKNYGITFKVIIVFEHFLKKNKKEFAKRKNDVLNQPIFGGVDVESLSISAFRRKFKTFRGVVVSTSGTITRLKRHIYDNQSCKYVVFSYFNDKLGTIMHNVDLLFISSARDLKEVSGLNVRIGLPYWALYSDLKEYDFQHLSPVRLPKNTYNIIIPEIFSHRDWHNHAYEWMQSNYKDGCSYIFKHRLKDDKRRNKNVELERKLRKYSNVYHIYDPFFFTTQKLLKNCDEVIFLSNKTLFIYECIKIGVRCRKAYDKADPNFFHFDPYLIDRYIENKSAVQQEIFSTQQDPAEDCFNEIIKLSELSVNQGLNKLENLKVVRLEEIDFSAYDFVKGKPTDRQTFFSLDNTKVCKTWGKGYQWADNVVQGIKSGYYDIKLIPNLYTLIKDREGCNRGYITIRVKDEQILCNFENIFSLQSWVKLIKGKTTLKRILKPKYKMEKKALVKLIYQIFSRALKTNMIFPEISTANLWTDNRDYYLFDLEACKGFDWFFNKDPQHPNYVRQAAHRNIFNRKFKILIEKHGLTFPMRINKEKDIELFWRTFVKINNLTDIPENLT